jgi:hypothetical protein
MPDRFKYEYRKTRLLYEEGLAEGIEKGRECSSRLFAENL